MPFAPVKSDPYKSKRTKHAAGPLWPKSVWKEWTQNWFDIGIVREANAALSERYRPKCVLERGNKLVWVGHLPPSGEA